MKLQRGRKCQEGTRKKEALAVTAQDLNRKAMSHALCESMGSTDLAVAAKMEKTCEEYLNGIVKQKCLLLEAKWAKEAQDKLQKTKELAAKLAQPKESTTTPVAT